MCLPELKELCLGEIKTIGSLCMVFDRVVADAQVSYLRVNDGLALRAVLERQNALWVSRRFDDATGSVAEKNGGKLGAIGNDRKSRSENRQATNSRIIGDRASSRVEDSSIVRRQMLTIVVGSSVV
jgi:hypothetical protein